MKKYISLTFFTLIFAASTAHAQIVPGWYYDENGNPLYYYANGVAYDPLTQSYKGSVVYPEASGPETLTFTPGVPNSGVGGSAVTAWFALIVSAAVAVAGTHYLTRSKAP